MNTAQVSIELVLAGILALCAFVLPFWRGTEISQDLLQTDALIGILGIAYLLGVVFDKLADTVLSPMEDYLRLQQANRLLGKGKKSRSKDAFPQNKLEFQLRSYKDGRLDWMNSLKSRIRTSREVAVLGLPASLGIAVYEGFTRNCEASSNQACPGQWIYIPVVLNLLFLAAAVWTDLRTPDEESTATKPMRNEIPASQEQEKDGEKVVAPNSGRIKTHQLEHDSQVRADQMNRARKQMHVDSIGYYLMVINSAIAIAFVSALRPENFWLAVFGLGGLIISLLSLWTCLRITRTYMKFIARASAEPAEEKSK